MNDSVRAARPIVDLPREHIDAAAGVAESTLPWWDAEIVAHELVGGCGEIARVTIATHQPLPYRAGQSLPLAAATTPARRRFYAPAHPPRPDNTIELHIKLVGTVSRQLVHAMGVRDRVRLGPPVGQDLTLGSTAPGADLLLVGAGTGIAPLRAVVEELAATPDHGRSVTLFYGARIASDLYDLPHLRLLEAQNSWLTLVPVVSDDQAWEGAKGPVGDAAAAGGVWARHEALIVGSAAMCQHTVSRLQDAGVPSRAIHLGESRL